MSEPIHPDTALGAVTLTVNDLERTRGFYERAIGLRTLDSTPQAVLLGDAAGSPLLELAGRPDAAARPPRTTGLFHLALLVPSRQDLARAVRRVIEAGWAFTGAADHLVSEALYPDDPEGNGIEIYRDRPRERWPRVAGTLQMATDPLDLEGVMSTLAVGAPVDGMPAGSRLGHVHLQVADLGEAEAFYGGVLGFDVTVRHYPGALFLSAGGYHHHIGLNVWAGRGAPAPPPGARGLSRFEVAVPDARELARIGERVAAAGLPSADEGGALVV
ncbi:MAG: catechol 2,3-dioxygenase, partial [Miltoncostaeaceae bacterium]|nr:catechol 2,3-dioxygenase [Miltoncostaeaceae bacterium]